MTIDNFENLINFNDKELIEVLNCEGEQQKKLWNYSSRVKNDVFGNGVFARGLIEFSNICRKNCLYCGIRSGNSKVIRYRLSIEDIMSCVDFVVDSKIQSIVLQSGELTTDDFKDYLRNVIKTIKNKYNFLNITLSSGEFDFDFY